MKRPPSLRGSWPRRSAARGAVNDEAQLHNLIDGMSAAIFVLQRKTICVANPAAAALTGFSRSELLGLTFDEIVHPEFRHLLRPKRSSRPLRDERSSRRRLKIIGKDGRERWIDYSARPLRFRGKTAVLATAIDITAALSVRERLAQTENHLRAFQETGSALMSTLELKSVLQLLLEQFDTVLPCPAVSVIRVINTQTGALEARALRNIDEEVWGQFIPRGGGGLTRIVLQTERPVVVIDALKDPRTRHPEFFRQNGLVSYLGLPLIVEDKIVGDVSFFTKRKHRFTNPQVKLLMSLASHAAIAIQNSQLYQAMRQRTDELAALNALAATTHSLDLYAVVDAAAQSMVELFHLDSVRIYLFDEVMQEAQLKSSFETDAGPWARVKMVPASDGIVGTVAKTGESMIFEDIASDPRYDQLSHTRGSKAEGARFFAVFPIRSKLKSWGSLSCLANQPRRVSAGEVDLLTAVCNQIGIAIENASLYQNTAAKAKELTALYSVAGISAQFTDMNALLYQSMRKVCEILGFSAGRIYILDEEKEIIRLVAQEGFPESSPPPATYPRHEGSIGKIIDRGEPLTFVDVNNEPTYEAMANTRFMSKAGFRGAVFIPLKLRGKTLGVMNLASREVHAFSPSDTQLINAVAYHLSIAIGNANLFSQLRQKTHDLEKANKAKDEFLSIISHELRTPLNLILGYAELIGQGMFGELSAPLAKAVSKVSNNTRGLLSMIESILVTTTIETGTIALMESEFDLIRFLEELKSLYDLPLEKETRLVWDIPAGPLLLTSDTEKLKRILQNLIDNAIKFTERGTVTVSTRVGTVNVVFTVSDTGIGIPNDRIPVIFDMFQQLDSSATRSHGGVGLGLYIVKQLTDLLKGKVAVESAPGKGSVFTVTIPLQAKDAPAGRDHSL